MYFWAEFIVGLTVIIGGYIYFVYSVFVREKSEVKDEFQELLDLREERNESDALKTSRGSNIRK